MLVKWRPNLDASAAGFRCFSAVFGRFSTLYPIYQIGYHTTMKLFAHSNSYIEAAKIREADRNWRS
jgi:hypothetical protein